MAAEEYFFRHFTCDILFLYSNEPSVVVGKHQNTTTEINPLFVFENDIKVIRRISGGGAVYHDRGNLNFSFHKTVGDTAMVRFSEFSLPVVEVLNAMGIPAEINTRNDIVVNGMKVSGHAQHLFRNRVLSHGTLLINSDLERLSASLKKSLGSYESKAIQSVRSNVANISIFSSGELTVETVSTLLLDHILQNFPGSVKIEISPADRIAIEELSAKKYSTWEWNYGYSPTYRFNNAIEGDEGEQIVCSLTVEKGIIVSATLKGNMFPLASMEMICQRLTGQRHSVASLFEHFHQEDELSGVRFNILKLLF